VTRLTEAQRSPNWFVNRRLEWIDEMLDIYGFINREHLIKKFGISVPQASADLKAYQRRWPDDVHYDKSAKRYVVTMRRSAGRAALEE